MNNMNRLIQWYWQHYTKITWFIIGWLTMSGLQDFSHGDYISAAWCLAVAALNYFISKR